MKRQFEMVKTFMEAGSQAVRQDPAGRIEEWPLRHELIKEELEEYRRAAEADDRVGVLDALVDLQYVLTGAVLAHGMQGIFEEAFQEVQDSNMTKCVNGKLLKREDGKVMKPESYRPPELAQFINGK